MSTVHTLLNLTKDRGLAVVDMQREVVFNPRGRVDVDVGTQHARQIQLNRGPLRRNECSCHT
jgi:hypothetical protein